MSRTIHRNQSQTPCAGRDEDLLMYVHGALPPMARMRTARHIHRCATCQQRAAALAATSQALADTVRGDALPRWTLPTLPTMPVWLAGGAALLLLAAASFFTVSLWTQNVQAHTTGAKVTEEQCHTPDSIQRYYMKNYGGSGTQISLAPSAMKASPSPSPMAPPSCLKTEVMEPAIAEKD